jgi:hypothetical protein
LRLAVAAARAAAEQEIFKMQLYELPGMLINPETVIVVNTANENGYVLHSVAGGEYHLSAEQTEVFKKLMEKDKAAKRLSVRSKHDPDPSDFGEGAVRPPADETFVPPIAPDHPLNDITNGRPPADQALDVSISLPSVGSPVIDASEDRRPDGTAVTPLTIDALASDEAKPAKAEKKAESKASTSSSSKDEKGK